VLGAIVPGTDAMAGTATHAVPAITCTNRGALFVPVMAWQVPTSANSISQDHRRPGSYTLRMTTASSALLDRGPYRGPSGVRAGPATVSGPIVPADQSGTKRGPSGPGRCCWPSPPPQKCGPDGRAWEQRMRRHPPLPLVCTFLSACRLTPTRGGRARSRPRGALAAGRLRGRSWCADRRRSG
jgi:hypothetical protein